jgi:imidazolonepropionase-like amidohydrolase
VGGAYAGSTNRYANSHYPSSLGTTTETNGYNGASTVVDANGATLMPGLIESHSHFSYLDYERVEQVGEIPPEEHMLGTMKNAELMLDAGFTSLFSAAGSTLSRAMPSTKASTAAPASKRQRPR